VKPTQRHGFVLLPGFSLLALGGALDALAAVNDLQSEVAYSALTVSLDGRPVRAGCSTLVVAAHGVADAPAFDVVFVVSDQPVPGESRDDAAATLQPWLRERAAAGALLGGIGTGAAALAQAGLLDGHRATLHWAHVQPLAEAHVQVVVSSNLYEIDRGRLTCAGSTASLDMLVAWLGQRHGERLAQELVAHFGIERLRPRDERQRVPLATRIGTGSSKLGEAVALMEANLGEPLPTEDVARLVGVSRRQLERLFKQHLDELPSRYYADLRLKRARRLLQQTSQSILQVGLACGFSSGSHFSNAYRARFGHTPREERSQRAAAWRDNLVSTPAPAPDAGVDLPESPAR
jgi:transcriptional regulator GlxA family with amidase domain